MDSESGQLAIACIRQNTVIYADELAGRQDLLLEKLAGVRRIFGGQDDDLFGDSGNGAGDSEDSWIPLPLANLFKLF